MELTGFHLLLCWSSVWKGKYSSLIKNTSSWLFRSSPTSSHLTASPEHPALSTDTSFSSQMWLPKPGWNKSLPFNFQTINTPSFSC